MVAALILVIPVPIPATGGYTHPGAVAEIFIALAFGPGVGMIAAGLGAATADLLLGFGSFAPLSLVAHGALGFLAGYLGWRKGLRLQVAGWILGGLALVLIYFLGEATIYGLGFPAAAAEVPVNLFQVSLGILGITLYKLVKAAYPQIELLGGEGLDYRQE
jgi:uncharacterized membrane protein